jgi:membrane protease YdiL (CAAX protease family)
LNFSLGLLSRSSPAFAKKQSTGAIFSASSSDSRTVFIGILISGAAFGAAHAYQGLQRAFVIGVSAVLFGLFAQWRGTVRPGMFAHFLQDAIAPVIACVGQPTKG